MTREESDELMSKIAVQMALFILVERWIILVGNEYVEERYDAEMLLRCRKISVHKMEKSVISDVKFNQIIIDWRLFT